jgi:hypothetical protein
MDLQLIVISTIIFLFIIFNYCKYNHNEAFGYNEYPNFGRPLHLLLNTNKNIITDISYQAPRGNRESGCASITCPPNTFDALPDNVKDIIPDGFQNIMACWSCNNYD